MVRTPSRLGRVSLVRVEPVDPRDARWERHDVAYRVYFWQGTSSDEWRLTEADVTEVLMWAREKARGRHLNLWLEHEENGELGLIRLAGWDQADSDPGPPWAETDA
jgi:hypothetical protein